MHDYAVNNNSAARLGWLVIPELVPSVEAGGVCRYLPVQRVKWQDIKGSQVLVGNYEEAVKMMGDTYFLSSLIRFPKEAITDETVELLTPYLKAQDFSFDSAMKVLAPPFNPLSARESFSTTPGSPAIHAAAEHKVLGVMHTS